jgi:hypothetical protein
MGGGFRVLETIMILRKPRQIAAALRAIAAQGDPTTWLTRQVAP